MAVFVDNSTAIAYLRKQGGTRSPVLNSIAQWILCWVESLQIVLAPQFIGEEQCLSRLSVQAQPGLRVGMDTEVGGVPGPSQEVAGDDRPGCHLVKSLLFTLFFTLPQSEDSEDNALLQNWDGLRCTPFYLGPLFRWF